MADRSSAGDSWLADPPGAPITADRVARQRSCIAAMLTKIGLDGARVGVAIQDQSQFLASVMAAQDRGATAVLLSSQPASEKTVTEIGQRIARAEPTLLIVDPAHRDALAGAIDAGIGLLSIEPGGPRWARQAAPAHRGPCWPGSALMVFTSGSTSLPKGVLLSRRCLDFLLDTHARVFQWTADDTYLAALPLTHVLGVVNLTSVLGAGGRAVVSPSFLWPEQVVHACLEQKVSVLGLVPYYLRRLLNHCGVDSLVTARQAVVSSAPVIPADVRQLKERLPSLQILHTYGLTEAFRSTVLSHEDVPERLPSIGKPVPGVEVQLRSEDGQVVDEPEGQGVAWIRGPNVMLGYWHDEALTRTVLKEGWFCTADVLHRGRDGYLTIVGRTQDVLNGGGEKLMAYHIEALIVRSLPVTEVMVLGLQTRHGFDHVVAVMALEPGSQVSLGDVRRCCAKAVHSVFIPRDIVIVDRLPRRENGKIDRSMVLDLARDTLPPAGPAQDPEARSGAR